MNQKISKRKRKRKTRSSRKNKKMTRKRTHAKKKTHLKLKKTHKKMKRIQRGDGVLSTEKQVGGMTNVPEGVTAVDPVALYKSVSSGVRAVYNGPNRGADIIAVISEDDEIVVSKEVFMGYGVKRLFFNNQETPVSGRGEADKRPKFVNGWVDEHTENGEILLELKGTKNADGGWDLPMKVPGKEDTVSPTTVIEDDIEERLARLRDPYDRTPPRVISVEPEKEFLQNRRLVLII